MKCLAFTGLKRPLSASALLLLVTTATITEAATTIRVPQDWPTIQQAIYAAQTGDTILVAPGTFYENIFITNKAVTVKSEQGPHGTIIDGRNGTGSVVTLNGGTLSGFTIANGHTSIGGGVLIHGGSPRVENNIIINNRACGGAGILIVGDLVAIGGGPAVVGNEIRGNSTTGCNANFSGAGVFVFNVGAGLISGNKIIGNSASSTDLGGGLLIVGSSLSIRENFILDNVAPFGGGMFLRPSSSSFLRIEQNIIAGNRADVGGGIAGQLDGARIINNTMMNNSTVQGAELSLSARSFSTSLVKNNVVVAEQNKIAMDCFFDSLASVDFAFNNVFSPQGTAYGAGCTLQNTNGNISVDPAFLDSASGNYQLRFDSPLIDAGTNQVHGLPATDLNSDPRITDGDKDGIAVIDMGAFEYNGRPFADAGPDQLVGCGVSCQANVTLDGQGSYDPDGEPLTFVWTGTFGTASGATTSVSLPRGQHLIVLTVTDPSGLSSIDSVVITVVDASPAAIASVSATPNSLLQANHQMVPVTVSVLATDNCDPSVACRIVSLTSNEPVDGLGDGDTAPDWIVTGDLTLQLRAERSGKGSGRIYTITVECVDSSGNKSKSATTVSVPRNN